MPLTGMNRPLQQGLVLWLKMSEGVGTRLHDVSGYRNNGTVNGASWVDGKYGKALSFDGIADKVTTSYVAAYSVSAWIKPVDPAGESGMIICIPRTSDTWPDPYLELSIVYESSTKILTSCNVNGVYKEAQSPLTYAHGNWIFVVGTYDLTALRLYVNGILVKTTDAIGDITRYNIGTWLGMRNDGVANRFKGIIDEVRIYSRALNKYEIVKLYRERGYV